MLPRLDGETCKNARASSSTIGIGADRPDLGPEGCVEPASRFTEVAVGEKARARCLLAAVRTLQTVERER